MQINRAGYLMVAFFGLGGAFAAMFPSTRLLGIIWVLVTLFLIGFAIQQRLRGSHEQKLFRSGLRSKATVVEAKERGTLNNQPMMHLVLDLEVPGQERRRVDHNLVMATFAARRMQPGLVLPAYVNPRDGSDFFVQW